MRPFSSAPHEETRQVWRPPGSERLAPPDAGGTRTSTSSTADAAAPALSESFPEMSEVFQVLQDMELQPGRNCIVGDGLTVVDVALYLDGVKVALQMQEQRPALSQASDPKAYALMRTMRSIMQAHGWHLVTLAAVDWRRLDSEQRPHYLAHCINTALGGGGGEQHSHSHAGGGCGSGGCGHSHHHHDHDHGHVHGHEHGHVHGAGGCGGGGGGCGSKQQQGRPDHGQGHDQGQGHQHMGAGGASTGTGGGGGSCGGGGGCGHKH
ncbi:hypothetical protein HYH02_007610 [Chlamydomonas schloesseri]|uniref:RAP domain-containing protein n=1 Tax=Chlamydomonas schloesseri TaxID=2026947 RepID=A0A835WH09_9CHLO|nr:hypothetical protein HYH02_007610 [Chlamydomonas schloesseri]|eukprot:KAG2447280.1 hypothetical protein HYH02_007610 [Chlamydomonas schloesseri]